MSRAALIWSLAVFLSAAPTAWATEAWATERPSGRSELATARCMLASAAVGSRPKTDPDGARRCLQRAVAELEAARATRSTPRIIAATRAVSACPTRLVIDRIAPDPEPEDDVASNAPDPSKAYLSQFQAVLRRRGEAVARCYSQLAKGVIPPRSVRGGRIAVEVAVNAVGRVDRVLLVESSGVNGYVVGCTVAALCALKADPPPAPFVLELPFTFEKPR